MVGTSGNTFAGDGIQAKNSAWTFGGDTPASFDKHIKKSIPFYLEGHQLVQKISEFFIHKNTICYELGTSTGKLVTELAKKYHESNAQFIGIDCEKKMIKKAVAGQSEVLSNLSFICDDINTYDYRKSDLMISYYTIQFTLPNKRQQLIEKIYQNLNWGGGFIMFEKVRSSDARFQDYMSSIYTDFKLEQGYTPEEIVNKSRSLKRVLEPFSTQGNYDLLKRAGFKDVMTVFKYACFEGILAIK